MRPDPPSLRVEETTTAEALEALRSEWWALWQRCPAATPFQLPEWLIPWYAHFAAPNPLWVLAVRHERRLVGLAPLFVHHWQGRDQLSLLGTGITDVQDLLAEPEFADAAARAVVEHLSTHRERWEVADLEQLPPDSPLLRAPVPDGIRASAEDHDVRLVVSLPATAGAFREGLSRHLRQNLRTNSHRLARAGESRFEPAGVAGLPEFMDALERLHTARWEERGCPGMLASPELRGFSREAAAGLIGRDALRPHTLRLDGRIIGVMYALADRQRVYVYLTGFDPAENFVSPGTLLLWHAITDAIREGRQAIDLLRGIETYKFAWGPHEVRNRRLRLRPLAAPSRR